MAEDLARLMTAPNDFEAEMICGLLRSGGIPAVKREKGVMIKAVFGSNVPQDIYVPKGRLQEARELIESFEERPEREEEEE